MTISYVPLPRTSPLVSEPKHEIKLPEATQLPFNQIGLPTELVLVPAAAGHGPVIDSVSPGKRRRKNKNKENKRFPRTTPLISEPQHKIKFQKATKPTSQQFGVRTEFVPVPAAAYSPCNDSIPSKKTRRKNKNRRSL